MGTPKHLAHKPIISVDDYAKHDGIYKNHTDAESLSVGHAQYDSCEISAKVFRYAGAKWSRQSEELPLHRVIDLSNVILKSILKSANIPYPKLISDMDIDVIDNNHLPDIVAYYKDPNNRKHLLPKLQELQIMINYFMNEEPKL